jgi:uncharacterized alpha-E superfamily protein
MISRVAENCFWLTRYIERAETLARVLDVTQSLHLDGSLPGVDPWRPLVIVCGEEEGFLERHGAEAMSDAEKVSADLTWNAENPASIFSSVACARENVRTIRETASLEMWETINSLWLWIQGRAASIAYADSRHKFYRYVRDQSILFEGMRHATMMHEAAYDFMQLGNYLERVSQTARILDVKYHSIGPDLGWPKPVETAQWLAALRSCSAVEPFFKRAANELEAAAVAGFLLFDPAFPRSVRHNLNRAALRLEALRPGDSPEIGANSSRQLSDMIVKLDDLTIERAVAQGMHEVLTWVVDESAALCATLRDDFFEWAPDVVTSAVEG